MKKNLVIFSLLCIITHESHAGRMHTPGKGVVNPVNKEVAATMRKSSAVRYGTSRHTSKVIFRSPDGLRKLAAAPQASKEEQFAALVAAKEKSAPLVSEESKQK